MKLTYRGVQYDYQPTSVDFVDSGLSGQYRGQRVNFTYPRHVPVPQTVATLRYRGVTYSTTANGGTKVMVQSAHPEMAPGEKPIVVALPLATQLRRLNDSESTKVHVENIRKRLQHRIEVAKATGNEKLLHQLEDEMQMFA
ncbi:MAG: hypothetical protein Kow00121_29640 [Elainellaceae cyanobacterium]